MATRSKHSFRRCRMNRTMQFVRIEIKMALSNIGQAMTLDTVMTKDVLGELAENGFYKIRHHKLSAKLPFTTDGAWLVVMPGERVLLIKATDG